MKRVLALILALLAVVASMGVLSGCSDNAAEEDLGAEIRAFFVGEVYDFDPAKAYTNDDAMKIMSLIYEPLFALDQNGTLQYALANGYEFYENHRGEFCLDITLRESYWNNGTDQVTASDFVYAWQRILDPNFPSQAATLLYDVKYAKEAKLNQDGITKYDAAISAQDQTLTVIFNKELTKEGQQNFLRNLTSVALAPVKESALYDDRENYWSKRVATIVTNGPFAIRYLDYGLGEVRLDQLEFRLERNNYYRRSQTSSIAKDAYVTPYKFLTYWDTELTDAFAEYLEEAIFYVGDIPLEQRAEYLSKADLTNMLSTYTYVLDTEDPTFENDKVRRALSMALNRALIASEATMGLHVPATGFVSHGVLNGASGSFADATAKSDYALKTDLEAAAALIRDAILNDGYRAGDINILVRDNAEERAIAEMVKTAWEEVFRQGGEKVTVNLHFLSSVTFRIVEDETYVTMPLDAVQEAYSLLKWDYDFKTDGDAAQEGFEVGGKSYNVIAMDYQMLSPDAFGALASFSYELSGNGIHLGGFDGTTAIRTHASGFNSDAFNAKIQAAYEETDMAKRNRLLHEAEELLLEKMPVIPILFNRSASLVNNDLNRVYYNYYGYAVFTRTELRNYHKHLITEED
ncbi:MAG: hypothetical protein IJ009_05460 [Clostridia bacterium]|nr:hypothetical protein [Clostridia bacterium]